MTVGILDNVGTHTRRLRMGADCRYFVDDLTTGECVLIRWSKDGELTLPRLVKGHRYCIFAERYVNTSAGIVSHLAFTVQQGGARHVCTLEDQVTLKQCNT